METRGTLQNELETMLRPHGVTARGLGDVLDSLHASLRQFSLKLDENMLDEFATLPKGVAYFAVFGHAPKVPNQVNSKFDDW